jgi:hypothetical protein
LPVIKKRALGTSAVAIFGHPRIYPNLNPSAAVPVDRDQIFKLSSFGDIYRMSRGEEHGQYVPNARFTFVKLTSGDTLMHQRFRHPVLAEGHPVLYAGEVHFDNGKLQWWSNGSGNYRPDPDHAAQAGLPVDQFFTHDAILKGEHTRTHASSVSRPAAAPNEVQAKFAAERMLEGVARLGSLALMGHPKNGSCFSIEQGTYGMGDINPMKPAQPCTSMQLGVRQMARQPGGRGGVSIGAPPVYRPQTTTPVQRMMATSPAYKLQQGLQMQGKMGAPPVFRPVNSHPVQAKTSNGSLPLAHNPTIAPSSQNKITQRESVRQTIPVAALSFSTVILPGKMKTRSSSKPKGKTGTTHAEAPDGYIALSSGYRHRGLVDSVAEQTIYKKLYNGKTLLWWEHPAKCVYDFVYTGNPADDIADCKARYGDLPHHIWHHTGYPHDESYGTMQLVPRSEHEAIPHYGGSAISKGTL